MSHNPNSDPASLVKDAPTIIHSLVDVVSKNGNLLLNFPQRGDGSLYPECEQVLDELARWMPINGEALFGTRPWTTFGEGPTQFERKSWLNELKHPMTVRDIRFTQAKDGRALYAIVCGVPNEPVRIVALAKQKIGSIALLGSDAKLEWKQTGDALVIQPVAKWPCAHAVVFKVQLAN